MVEDRIKITTKQKYNLKKIIKELEKYKGRHTELVTVYIPANYDINKITTHLQQEQGTATNIKSTATRKNVIDALEKMLHHLKLFKQTPQNGLAVFSGNITEREGQSDVKVWSLEPPMPLKIRLYRCDKSFVLDPLRDMVEEKEVFGLVVMDRRDAMLALLKGKTVIPIRKTHSEVPGKIRAGGQCCAAQTLIQLYNGEILPIEKSQPFFVLHSADFENYVLTSSPITAQWKVQKSPSYKIITSQPRLEIETSKDHVFFVNTPEGIKEKSAEELKENDQLLMPEEIKIKGKIQIIKSKQYHNSFIITEKGRELIKKKREEKKWLQKELAQNSGLTQTSISFYEIGKNNISKTNLLKICSALNLDPDEFLEKYAKPNLYHHIKLPLVLDGRFAQFLGYLIGDGCIEKDRITFFEQEKDLAFTYKQVFDAYFEIISSYKFRTSKNYHQLRFTNRPLVRLIQQEFPEVKKTRNTLIPKKILISPKEIVASFIKGFFDAEGYVSRSRIGLGINNKFLAQELQMVLLRFGIVSSLHEYDNRANKYSNNPRFIIDLSEKHSLYLFKKYIGFTSKKKTEKLEAALKNKSEKSTVRQILFPGTKIRELLERAGYQVDDFPKVSNFFRDKRKMSKETYKNSILGYVKNQKLYSELKKIHSHSLLPVNIHHIQIIEKQTNMHDISVENQNFIANGLMVHNSAQRFARIREGAIKDHYKKIAEYMKEEFLGLKGLKGIIIGGPSTTTNEFMGKEYLTGDLKKKILGIKDLAYTGEFGLQELLDRSADLLAAEEIAEEKKLMSRFFDLLAVKPNMAAYGEQAVRKVLEMGVVDILLLSEDLNEKVIEELETISERYKTEVQIISTETREGVQLRDLGKIAAILRYEMET